MEISIARIGIIILMIGVITFSGCTEIQTKENTITIQNSTFNPKELTINVGTAVYWVNNDSIPHKIVSDNGTFESQTLNSGDKFHYNTNNVGDILIMMQWIPQ